MIGNDVVDLLDRDADIASYRSGFDHRVFAGDERASIAGSLQPNRQRWRLWAAKEAAFKAAKRCDRSTVFSPSAFKVEIEGADAEWAGTVDHLGTRYRVMFRESERWIHAIATRGVRGFERVIAAVRRGENAGQECESLEVRRLAREHVARHLDVRPGDLEIRRDSRIPSFWLRGRKLDLCLSLSHSGGIVAFACVDGEYGIG